MALEFKGVKIGKYVASSLIRQVHGRIDPLCMVSPFLAKKFIHHGAKLIERKN
jgi:hypothetical protein